MSKKISKAEEARNKILVDLNIKHRSDVIARYTDSNDTGDVIAGERAKKSFGLEGVLKEQISPPGLPALPNKAAFDVLPADRQQQYLDMGAALRAGPALSRSVTTLGKERETAFQDDEGKYHKNLVSIADDEGLLKNAGEDDQLLLSKYHDLQRFEKLYRRAKEGKKLGLSGKEEHGLKEAMIHGAERNSYEFAKSRGYRERDRQLFGKIGAMTAEDNPKNLEAGIKALVEKTREDLQSHVGKGKSVEQEIGKAVANTVLKMRDSRDAKEQEYAMSLYHKAFTGYDLGDQPLKELYQ